MKQILSKANVVLPLPSARIAAIIGGAAAAGKADPGADARRLLPIGDAAVAARRREMSLSGFMARRNWRNERQPQPSGDP
ncbi:hypothetical protein GE300_17440 [Rhodobacteraceae bacterium 2CG4]|uniref:Uncharacterized protein n=1 Tax=Halovulum marinum TaxID=2662447 RepID=A0A6L5Z4I7_9RHOB|nr:hypothetical protein [Halovulum marinum]MSU91367.1 hypothetical protein [Halovulum marinum]